VFLLLSVLLHFNGCFLLSFSPLLVCLFLSPDISYHIDSGGPTNVTDLFNTNWLSDRFFTGGSSSVVSEPLRFRHPQEKTLRYFPLSSGKKNCYIIPLPSGRYYFRTFTIYDNYDGKSHSPSFDASVEGTLVFSWRSPWAESLARDGAYSDLFAFVNDGEADFCFYSMATDPPVIGSIEIRQVDPLSYSSSSLGGNFILVNYGRLSCGSDQWGPGFSNDTDYFGRSWQSDEELRTSKMSKIVHAIATTKSISGVIQAPNYFPMKLYQSAVTGNGVLEYEIQVDAKLDYLLWFHFAEIESSINKKGQRVFDVLVNEKNASRVDIFAQVGNFAAYSFSYTVHNLSSTALSVKLVPLAGSPLISGIENYALVPSDMATEPEQVVAMKALKDSLRVPARMGWNGDPCAPTSWDAWEGVTCHPNKNESALVISQMNLSGNSLGGTLPEGLGQKSLIRLDLSGNQFSGPIPESLTSSSLQLMFLNDNLLEGRVPEELYSIGMHGGSINLSGNKGLCGVPSLPDCSLLWDNGHLSKGGIIGIAISSVLVFLVILFVVYICCFRRGRHEYDFAPAHDLTSMAAKRNRYQRQKSLMLLEMESQHAKALSSPQVPNN
ncbi:Receptor-like protein 4, partial [Linum perenne]